MNYLDVLLEPPQDVCAFLDNARWDVDPTLINAAFSREDVRKELQEVWPWGLSHTEQGRIRAATKHAEWVPELRKGGFTTAEWPTVRAWRRVGK